MHYNLLSVWHKDSDSIVLGILFKASLCLLDSSLNLLKAAQINFVKYLVMYLFEVFFFELYLV